MSTGELACTYAAAILHDDGIPITAEKIATLVKSANVEVESFWPSLFAKFAEKRNLGDLIMNAVGSAPSPAAPPAAASAAAPAVEEKKEEPEEESDDDMPIFDLFN